MMTPMFRKRWTLFRLAGIPVRLHISFSLIVLLVVLASLSGGWSSILFSLSFLIAAYACVIAHEFGHCLMARHRGIETKEVMILPIGGVAVLEKNAKSPRHELEIALAGPAVNVAILAVLVPVIWLFGLIDHDFIMSMAVFNLIMIVFNMIPAFPMDGGRVLRALLWRRKGKYDATQIAVRLGRVIAVIMGIAGIVLVQYSPALLLIAVFIWIAGGVEARSVKAPPSLFQQPDPLFRFGEQVPKAFQRWGSQDKDTVTIDAEVRPVETR